MQIDPSSFQAALALERGRVVSHDGTCFLIPLTAKRPGGRPGGWDGTCTLVSPEDKELAQYAWSADAYGYARRRCPETGNLRMHREVLGLGKGVRRDSGATLVADHINGDKLDNRRENLRICTQGENAQNVRTKNGHRGVNLDKRGGSRPWIAEGKKNGRKQHIGRFATEQEAAEAAAVWRRENLPFTTN